MEEVGPILDIKLFVFIILMVIKPLNRAITLKDNHHNYFLLAHFSNKVKIITSNLIHKTQLKYFNHHPKKIGKYIDDRWNKFATL